MDNHEKIAADLKRRSELHKSKMVAIDSELRNSLIARWRSQAGMVADAMLESPSRALKEAESPTGHQLIAIDILANYWKVSGTTEVLDTLLDVLRISSDEYVRATAIRAVSSGLNETQNPFWLRFMAETVLRESETKLVRSNAYFALFIIAGRSLPINPDATELLHFNEHFPQNVNWGFVNHCLTGDVDY